MRHWDLPTLFIPSLYCDRRRENPNLKQMRRSQGNCANQRRDEVGVRGWLIVTRDDQGRGLALRVDRAMLHSSSWMEGAIEPPKTRSQVLRLGAEVAEGRFQQHLLAPSRFTGSRLRGNCKHYE